MSMLRFRNRKSAYQGHMSMVEMLNATAAGRVGWSCDLSAGEPGPTYDLGTELQFFDRTGDEVFPNVELDDFLATQFTLLRKLKAEGKTVYVPSGLGGIFECEIERLSDLTVSPKNHLQFEVVFEVVARHGEFQGHKILGHCRGGRAMNVILKAMASGR